MMAVVLSFILLVTENDVSIRSKIKSISNFVLNRTLRILLYNLSLCFEFNIIIDTFSVNILHYSLVTNLITRRETLKITK